LNLTKVTASVALAALFLGTAAGPALADNGGNGRGHGQRISQNFEDMSGFDWGLSQVVRMQVKGIFKGRGPSLFAPGAKISHQEGAVATVRLMDKEAEAQALAAADIDTLLKDMPDRDQVAPWAKASVAMLIKLGVVPADKPFSPGSDATRLDVAVMLVKAMGFGDEVQAQADAELPFQDAAQIPAELRGYVAVAVQHNIITGVEQGNGRFFFPDHAVKRIEMAVMMGRADRLIDRARADELKGTVTAVDRANNAFTMNVKGQSVKVTLAAEAAVFVDDAEATLADLKADMKAEVKLNAERKAIYIEAKTRDDVPATQVVEGSLTALTAATTTAPAAVKISGVSYQLAPTAVITMDSAASNFAGLRVGDTARATLVSNQVVRLEASRTITAVAGSVVSWTAASQTAAASLSVSSTANGQTAVHAYTLEPGATVEIDSSAGALADLLVGDNVSLTLASGLVRKVAVTRIQPVIIQGSVAVLTPAVAGTTPTPNRVMVGSLNNSNITFATYDVTSSAQIYVNGAAAHFSDLQVNDSVKLTLVSNAAVKVEATR
jgi:hypothetical protein